MTACETCAVTRQVLASKQPEFAKLAYELARTTSLMLDFFFSSPGISATGGIAPYLDLFRIASCKKPKARFLRRRRALPPVSDLPISKGRNHVTSADVVEIELEA